MSRDVLDNVLDNNSGCVKDIMCPHESDDLKLINLGLYFNYLIIEEQHYF